MIHTALEMIYGTAKSNADKNSDKWRTYNNCKRMLNEVCLTPREYEQAIEKVAAILGI